MIYDPDQGIRVLKGNTWSLAGGNPAIPSNEVTPIVYDLNASSFRCGWVTKVTGRLGCLPFLLEAI